MQKRQIWLTLLALFLLLVACGGDALLEEEAFDQEAFEQEAAEVVPDNDEWLTAYTAFIEERTAVDNIPGTAVAVIAEGEIVLVQGFGYRDVANQLPVTPDTLFHIGSTNKSMTAMLIATLVDEGVVDWDTAVVDIYPDFPLDETITLRHLLNMTSGLPDEAEYDFDVDNSTAEDLLSFLVDIEPFADPGEEFSYSNISSSVAGYLAVMAAEADGAGLYEGYRALLQERVLTPIGMTTAVVNVSDAQRNPNYGKSYWLENGQPVEADPEDYDGDPLAPSGVLKASVADMALYVATYVNNGVAPNGTRLISTASLDEMTTPALEDYALGWEVSNVDGYDVISHEGSYDNYLSLIGFVPELELGFVILTNSDEAAEALVADVPAVLLELYGE